MHYAPKVANYIKRKTMTIQRQKACVIHCEKVGNNTVFSFEAQLLSLVAVLSFKYPRPDTNAIWPQFRTQYPFLYAFQYNLKPSSHRAMRRDATRHNDLSIGVAAVLITPCECYAQNAIQRRSGLLGDYENRQNWRCSAIR